MTDTFACLSEASRKRALELERRQCCDWVLATPLHLEDYQLVLQAGHPVKPRFGGWLADVLGSTLPLPENIDIIEEKEI